VICYCRDCQAFAFFLGREGGRLVGCLRALPVGKVRNNIQ